MDAKSLWLTTNADTIYIVGFLDLTKGPMVLETAPGFSAPSRTTGFAGLSTLDCPAPDRGEGGKYLIVPPGYDGPLPRRLLNRALPDQLRGLVRPLIPGEP